MSKPLSLDEIFGHARHLSPREKLRLVEWVASDVEQELEKPKKSSQASPSRWGALAHLGSAPSRKDIEDARNEAWGRFPREDV